MKPNSSHRQIYKVIGFCEKVDTLFASHSLYFILGDLHKASEQYSHSSVPLSHHPLWKYFNSLQDQGVFVVTLQTGAGARLFRNALLVNHGLYPSQTDVVEEVVPFLSSFGNMATFLQHVEVFKKRYQQETGNRNGIKMLHSVANVPLDNFEIGRDSETGGLCCS